jgi:hypothetical protein
MNFEKALNESYARYTIHYTGTRPEYKIHDDDPYILLIDGAYNPDNKGNSILGINLNYYQGDVKKLINKINKFDNKQGFFGFETKLKVKKFLKTKDIEEYEVNERNRRYKTLISEFPELKKLIRRYKFVGKDGEPGIEDQKKKWFK